MLKGNREIFIAEIKVVGLQGIFKLLLVYSSAILLLSSNS